MATATASLSIDPSKGAKYPITVAERLLNSGTGTKRNHASVQCMDYATTYQSLLADTLPVNHKPKLSNSKTTTTISKVPSGGYNLRIKDNDSGKGYGYRGSQKPTEACVLIYNPSTKQMTLDKLDTQFDFDLQSTPTNNDAQSLAQKYPHIGAGQSSTEAEVNGDTAEAGEQGTEEAADANNPYDYRHFLYEASHRRSPTPEARSRVGSPAAQRPSTFSSPAARPVRPAPRPKPRPRPQQKRPASTLREEADADNEDSEDDFVIEMEPDTKRRNRFMGAFDRDITSNGPISLRSAASSMSPAARIARDDSVESQRNRNADVEELKLPSPRRSPPVRTPQEEAEDEADLEAELEMALEESQADQEDGGVGLGITNGTSGVAHDESSSESEEE